MRMRPCVANGKSGSEDPRKMSIDKNLCIDDVDVDAVMSSY